MTLGTHAVVGAAVASLVPDHAIWAFVGGFASHFLLDAIPHWDYKLLSAHKDKTNKMNNDIKIGRNFILDLFRIGADALIGITLALFIFHNSPAFPSILLVGAIGAMIPDFLQFVYFKFRRQPLISIQRFHIFIHAEKDLNDRPVIGIIYQLALITVVSIVAKLLV